MSQGWERLAGRRSARDQQASSVGARLWSEAQNLERHGRPSQKFGAQGSENPVAKFSEVWCFSKTLGFIDVTRVLRTLSQGSENFAPQGSQNPGAGFSEVGPGVLRSRCQNLGGGWGA